MAEKKGTQMKHLSLILKVSLCATFLLSLGCTDGSSNPKVDKFKQYSTLEQKLDRYDDLLAISNTAYAIAPHTNERTKMVPELIFNNCEPEPIPFHRLTNYSDEFFYGANCPVSNFLETDMYPYLEVDRKYLIAGDIKSKVDMGDINDLIKNIDVAKIDLNLSVGLYRDHSDEDGVETFIIELPHAERNFLLNNGKSIKEKAKGSIIINTGKGITRYIIDVKSELEFEDGSPLTVEIHNTYMAPIDSDVPPVLIDGSVLVDNVRMKHTDEVQSSNFNLGSIVAYIHAELDIINFAMDVLD